jgi:guanine deaminase
MPEDQKAQGPAKTNGTDMPENRFMTLAIEEAYNGVKAGDGGPFGAVVVKGAEVLAASHNRVISGKDPTKHAEINAISLAAEKLGTYDLSGCEIYTTTEPCPMCFSAIHWARIKKIVYGTKIGDVKKLGFNELSIPACRMKEAGSSPVEIEGGFMLSECERLLEFWKGLPDRQTY